MKYNINPYQDTEFCAQRLFAEYKKHSKLIVAVDFDDTVFDFHNRGACYQRIKTLLNKCSQLGFYIVCFTASEPERHRFIEEHFKREFGISLDAINKNVVELPYGNHSKIYFNILLDDKAGLGQAMDILGLTLCYIDLDKIEL